MKTSFLSKVIALLLVSVIILSSASADMRTFLDQTVIQFDAPSSYSGAGSNYYFGGGIHIRTPTMTLQPFSITPPSFRAGCGGIDFTFGAFQYFRPDQFVKFAKTLMSNAPGFAFMIGMDMLCPKCQELMNKLTALANQLNSLQLDACKTLDAIASSLLRKETGTGEGGPMWMDQAISFLESATEQVSRIVNYLSAGDQRSADYWIRTARMTLLEEAMKDFPMLSDTASIYFLTGVFGNMAAERVIRGDGYDPEYNVRFLEPAANSHDIFIKWIYGGGNCEQTRVTVEDIDVLVSVAGPGYNCGRPESSCVWNSVKTNVTVESLCYKTRQLVDDMIDSFIERRPLSSTSIQLLGVLPLPMTRFLNIASSYPELLQSQGFKEALYSYINGRLAQAILAKIKTEIIKKLHGINSKDEDMKPFIVAKDYWLRLLNDNNFGAPIMDEIRRGQEMLTKAVDNLYTIVNVEMLLTEQLKQKGIWNAYTFSRALATSNK